ncbi:hypothetical protein BO94DRAFT_583126 [Aspergillus sclerotioniger CBS 115572]|uniref:Zn(2)-C6 fungal-type domain-containing protein n=1 Tax=Aspergillus sclerotioniger CBS 115572 TaxID=1450535 RepID=A0A317XB53_9EURO|nr:hypothetical protein BO94DRAFT_583126 [Aspergillus sclerotioniger CBS 115572]PWY93760.1 hypothetical protein BO94DRAFT_583126 [Aspergillus sclerotioniger CBS 115572]
MATQRRNGQLSSCEPCRKGKLRCDHQVPVCGRCARRDQASRCIYHPAPMTRPGRSTVRKRTSRVQTSQSQPLQDLVDWSPRPGGWLGLTSPQGIFADLEPPEDPVTPQPGPVDPQQVTVGVSVLQRLDDLSLYKDICDARYASLFKPWAFGAPFVQELVDHIRRLHHGEEGLEEVAKTMFRNSHASIVVRSGMTFAGYIGLLAGRWEGIGLLFAITGASIHHIRGEHPVFVDADKRSLQMRMAATAATCIQLCENAGLISEPLTWLLFQQTILVSILWGNTDYRAWKLLGDASTMAFALGLHEPDPADPTVPFFLAELRKRTMAAGYIVDKELATVLGRPPRISHRYCDLLLPLDLSYAEMIADVSTREVALSELDANGWNRQGLLSKGAHPRVGILIAKLREKVLEVISCRELDNLPERIEELCISTRQTRSTLPTFLHWTPNNTNPSIQSIHLDFLYTEFLLYRISVKRTGVGSIPLIRIAHEILSLILDRIADIANPDRTFSAIVPVDSSLCYYALPCAGVLATELLHQHSSHSQPQPPEPSPGPEVGSGGEENEFPRAEIIQKLSIFVFFLETYVPPGQANYVMSMQARRVVRGVLNRVLVPPSAVSMNGTSELMGGGQFSGGGEGMENIDWLDVDVDVDVGLVNWGQEMWWGLT